MFQGSRQGWAGWAGLVEGRKGDRQKEEIE
jgi:hypothetical protein